MLDTIRTFETPEGTELELRTAGVGPRLLAWLIDWSIWFALAFILIPLSFALFGKFGVGLFLIVLFFLWWFYDVYFEVARRGATPGKKAMGLRVVHDDGTPVSWNASIVRNLLRSVDYMPFFYFFGLLSSLLNKDFKRLGDLAAGTLVIYADSAQGKQPKIPEASPAGPPVWLSQEEQRSLIDFAERRAHLSTERVIELADLLEPLTGKTGADSATRIFQYANWLLGRR